MSNVSGFSSAVEKSSINNFFLEEGLHFQEDGAPPHYHTM
jgi:hypothetical protein